MLRWCTPAESLGSILYLPNGRKKLWTSFVASLPPEKKVQWYRYEIKRGDNVESLAAKYNVAADALTSINRVATPRLVPGHHLFIPISPVALPSTVAYSSPPESEIRALDLPDYEFSGIALRHRVRSGDCLGKIARHYHVSVTQLCRWNRLTGRTLLKPGRILIVSRPQPPMEPALPPAAVAAAAPAPPRVQPDTVGKQVPQEKAAPAQPAPAVAMPPKAVETHVVEIGETPFSISRKTNVPIKDLAALNGLDMAHPIVKIGQVLVLGAASVPVKVDSTRAGTPLQKPSASPQVVRNGQNRFHVIAPGEDVFRISLRYSVSVDSLLALNRKSDALQVRIGDTLLIPPGKDTLLKPPASASRPDVIYYKVKDGDTLPRIAAELGVPVDSLYKENQLRPDTILTPGKVIRIVKVSGM